MATTSAVRSMRDTLGPLAAPCLPPPPAFMTGHPKADYRRLSTALRGISNLGQDIAGDNILDSRTSTFEAPTTALARPASRRPVSRNIISPEHRRSGVQWEAPDLRQATETCQSSTTRRPLRLCITNGRRQKESQRTTQTGNN